MRETAGRETLKILRNGVTINIVNSGALPEPAAFLSPAEIKKYNSFKIPKRKTDWLGGRYAAKTLLASALSRKDLVNIEISYDNYGRPLAAGQTISISHSGGLALAALKPGGGNFLGADIEFIEDRCAAWYADYFHPEELPPQGGGKPEHDCGTATRLWALKESLLKALGLGLRADLLAIKIGKKIEFSGLALQRYRELGSPGFSVETRAWPEGFWTAVAVGKK